VKSHGVGGLSVDAFDDVDFAAGMVSTKFPSIPEDGKTHFLGHSGPTVQKAGQVPQPSGMWAMSRMMRP